MDNSNQSTLSKILIGQVTGIAICRAAGLIPKTIPAKIKALGCIAQPNTSLYQYTYTKISRDVCISQQELSADEHLGREEEDPKKKERECFNASQEQPANISIHPTESHGIHLLEHMLRIVPMSQQLLAEKVYRIELAAKAKSVVDTHARRFLHGLTNIGPHAL